MLLVEELAGAYLYQRCHLRLRVVAMGNNGQLEGSVWTLWKLGVAMVVSAYTAARGTGSRTLRPRDENFCIRTRETAGLATGVFGAA